jgi:hypothetical protein
MSPIQSEEEKEERVNKTDKVPTAVSDERLSDNSPRTVELIKPLKQSVEEKDERALEIDKVLTIVF